MIGRRAVFGFAALQALVFWLMVDLGGAGTVAGGASHTLVVRTTDGTAWAWGLNTDGQLGDNTTTQRQTPIQVSLSGVVSVAAGAKHNLALTSAGVLYAWGDNYYGQIGNGNNTDQKLPVQVMTGVAQIAVGDYHSIALKTDGTVHLWGANNESQLADGSTANRNTPYQVTGLGLVNAIAGGGNHTLVVLAAGGSMKAWGKNTNGQLGDGSTYARASSPVAVSTVVNATNAAGGYAFSLARLFDGRLYSWGYNTNGQLGLGDTTQRPAPTLLTTPTSVAAIAVGGYHALALLSNGSVSAWGHNYYGSVGDGSGTQRMNPVPLPALSSVVAIAAGQYHSAAVTSTGEVWVWGYNNYSQIGDGTMANQLSPVKIAEAGFNWKVATPTFSPVPGTYAANQNVTISCATTGATIRYTTNGTEPTSSSTPYSAALPVTVSTTLKARAFKSGLADSSTATGVYTLKVATPSFSPAGGTYTTAQTVTMTVATTGAAIRYTTDGSDPTMASTLYGGPVSVPTTRTLKAAGFKSGWTTSDLRSATYTMNFGTLAAPTFSPAPAAYLDSVAVTISAAAGATIRYTTNGATPGLTSALYTAPVNLSQTTTLKAKAWKVDYAESAVSSGTYTLKVATPLLSRAPGSYPAGTAVTVTAATAGATLNYSLDGSDPTQSDPVVASGGSIVLGNYTLRVRSFKVGCDPSDIVSAAYTVSGQLTTGSVSAGKGFALAVLPDGTLWSWGSTALGKLGTGVTSGSQPVPAPVETLTGVVSVSAGDDHALALTSSGAVWSWGANGSGQLGLGSTSSWEAWPRQVTTLSGVTAVVAATDFSAALRSNGTLWVWGKNSSGQLGLGDTTSRLVPTQVLSGVAAVALGQSHVVVRKSDGSVWSWGTNASGQLGDGTTTARSTPAQVNGLAGATLVTAGGTWTMAKAGGLAYSWGDNGYGQLGDGTTTVRKTPTVASLLSNATALDGGVNHSLGLMANGSVTSWGASGYGQLGDGTTTNHSTPAAVPGLSGIIAVTAGDSDSFALASDGSLWAWGWNYYERLGDGTSDTRTSPIKIRDGSLWKVGTPTFSPPGGAQTAVQTVTISVATTGATVRYTTNGADPVPGDPQIPAGGAVTVDRSLTLKAASFRAGMAVSNVASAVYTLRVATPAISPYPGTYNTPQTATISCTVSGATIRYTTNGVDPTPSDPIIASGGTVSIDVSQTIKAKAWKSGWTDSAVAAMAYTLKVATPGLTPSGGSYAPGQLVTVSTASPGVELHYSTTGVEPTPSDPVVAVGGTFALAHTATLKVGGWRPGWTPSDIGFGSYVVTEGSLPSPTATPAPGAYTGPVSVTLACSVSDAVIRYSLDGTVPGPTSPVYTQPITLVSSVTLSARAFKAGWSGSSAMSGAYSIQTTATGTPIITPSGGRFAAGRTVQILGPAGATLRYTTNGSDPTESDTTVASGAPITIGRSLRLKARAWKTGLDPSAVAAADFSVVGAVAAGSGFTIVLKSDGTLAGWGFGGRVGDGTSVDRYLPVPVTGLDGAVAVSAAKWHTLVLKADGTVFAWGSNTSYRLGTGDSIAHEAPTQVVDANGPLSGVVAISAGGNHSLALKQDGTVWAWGLGAFGEMGDGAQASPNRAVQVPGLSGVSAIAAGGDHNLALQTDGGTTGVVWAWGRNDGAQLGDGSLTNRLRPIVIATGVSQVTAGTDQTIIVKSDGTIWGAGFNQHGELGDRTLVTPRPTLGPVLVGVPAATKISAGGTHTLVLTAGEGIWGTGQNHVGQVGDGSRTDRSTPAPVAGLPRVLDVVAARVSAHSVAMADDGRVWTWGNNLYGALGTGGGSGDNSYVPRPLAGFSAADQTWPLGDPDGDGLLTEEEIGVGSDPFNPDTNGDEISDLVAVRSGLSATNPDMDGDGIANVVERAQGTDPLRADSDADGVADGADCFPLDPTRSTCPVPQPGDVTPPVITLSEPTNAVLVNSVP